jgi:tetratricopeptide (TPR) repeat protein
MNKRAFSLPLICLVIGITVALCGCGVKARKAGGSMDTPETHYKQGMKYWMTEKWGKAEEEFNLAKSLDKKFAPAYAGLALTTAKKAQYAADKKTENQGFDEALKLAEQAQELGGKIPDGFIAKALVLTMKHEGKDEAKKWLPDVEKQYEKALKNGPNNPFVYFMRGSSYKRAFEFAKAAADFKQVLEIKGDFTAEADEQWALIQKIERAAPGTDVGKRIALVDRISRADIAALFVSELEVDKLMEKRRALVPNTEFKAPDDPREMQVDTMKSMPKVTDIDNHWAKNFILDIVDLSIRGLEPYPDHTFKPDDLINRGEYAMMVEDVLIAILGDETLATKNIGATESRFPDVNPSYPAYNAICNAVDKGIMDAEMNGAFGPEKSVSGADALLVIRKIKELNKV